MVRREVNTSVAQAAIEAARLVLLKALDSLIAKAPDNLKPGLQSLRDSVAVSSEIPAQLVNTVFAVVGKAFTTGDFGPATYDPTDSV